jgi:hypothetical protein
VGNRWTYEHETRDGAAKSPKVIRWKTQETIVGTLALPEGTVVLRHVEVEGESPGGWLTRYGESHYLIRNSCLYFLDKEYSWNEQDRQLSPEFRAKLRNGEIAPAFCFPMATGKSFGKDTPSGPPPKVVGQGRGSGFTPSSVSEKAFRIAVNLFTADTTRFWFEKGVGITGEWDLHHGTYSEYRVRLLQFQPAVSAADRTPRPSPR